MSFLSLELFPHDEAELGISRLYWCLLKGKVHAG